MSAIYCCSKNLLILKWFSLTTGIEKKSNSFKISVRWLVALSFNFPLALLTPVRCYSISNKISGSKLSLNQQKLVLSLINKRKHLNLFFPSLSWEMQSLSHHVFKLLDLVESRLPESADFFAQNFLNFTKRLKLFENVKISLI
jgi:hypothetical protein